MHADAWAKRFPTTPKGRPWPRLQKRTSWIFNQLELQDPLTLSVTKITHCDDDDDDDDDDDEGADDDGNDSYDDDVAAVVMMMM